MEKHPDGFWYMTPEEEKNLSKRMRKKGFKVNKGRLHWSMWKNGVEIAYGHHDTTKNWLIKILDPEEVK